MPRPIHDVGLPALADEIQGPPLAAVGRTDEARPGTRATVKKDDRRLMGQACRNAIFDIHRVGFLPNKEITLGKRDRLCFCSGRGTSHRNESENYSEMSVFQHGFSLRPAELARATQGLRTDGGARPITTKGSNC